MPQKLEDLVQTLLADPDFYKGKDPDERRSIAYAIAQKQLNGSVIFEQVNAPTDITIKATGSGDLLVFRGAVLARAERNRNGDEITEQGITELAATIGGRAIDIEHWEDKNCGVFTGGQPTEDGKALVVDGIIWADRAPQQSQGVQDGTHSLSIEANADIAQCSVCGNKYANASEYCQHLTARREHNATRTLHGLRARGGAVTKRPAGTDTKFDPAQIYFVASHAEVQASWYDSYLKERGETLKDLPDSDFADPQGRRFPYKIHGKVIEAGWRAAWSASKGGHTGVADESAVAKLKRDKPKGIDIESEEDMNKCPKCGHEFEGAVVDVDSLKAQLESMKTSLESRIAELTTQVADAQESQRAVEARFAAKEAEFAASQEDNKKLRLQVRHTALPRITADDWQKHEPIIARMDDAAFNLFAGAYNKPAQVPPAGLRLPDPPDAGGTDREPLSLK